MNIAVSIPQPKCAYTLKQLKQLLIAYAQLTNREPYGLCAAKHLFELQAQGQFCPLLIALYAQEQVLTRHIKQHKILGGCFLSRPSEVAA